MGTGGGMVLASGQIFNTYAFLGVWDSQKSADDF